MSRDLTAAMQSAMTAGTVHPILLAAIEVNGGYVRVWTGIGNLVFGGNTYSGIGTFGGVTPVQESSDISAKGCNFTLSGIPSDLVSTALQSVRQGLSAKLWLGAFNETTGALIADPYLLFSGLTDVPMIEDGADTATITLSAENRLIDLDRARTRRYTQEDQKLRDPTDTGFRYVPSLQDAQISWGT